MFFEIDFVHPAHFAAVEGAEPRRKSSVVPLAADEWAGADDDIQPEFLCGIDKAAEVEYPGVVEMIFLFLVLIPGEIGFNRIYSDCFGSGQAVFP